MEFTIRVNDYCKDKDKEVNAASVVNVSEQETHRLQEHEVKVVNENEQSCAAMQKSKSETPLEMKDEKPKMPCFMVMYANISFLRPTFSMLLKNIIPREMPFLFFVHVRDQNQQS